MDVSIFRPKVEAILRSSDLETISAKTVRKQLQSDLGLDLSAHKTLLNGLIRDCFERFTEASATRAVAGAEPKVEYQEPNLSTAEPREESKPKKIKREVKSEPHVTHLDDNTDADAKYARELQAQYSSTRASRSAGNGASPKRKRIVKKKRKTETIINSDGEIVEVEAKKRKVTNNGFNKLLTLSGELSELLNGTKYLSRPQVAKHIWAYIKSEDLQDQSDKRYINCDAKLSNLLGVKKVHMFTMTKLLQKHMLDDGTAPKMEITDEIVVSDEDVKPKFKKEESLESDSG